MSTPGGGTRFIEIKLQVYSMAFIQSCWHILKLEIMEFFQNFHAEAIFENCLNGFFLALILKKVDAMDARDFRPIILVWGWGG